MRKETKLIKGLFVKLDSDLFSIEEEVFLTIEAKEARITELENALNGMLEAYEYDGQGEGENVACWDARVALQVHGYNKTVKEIAKGEKE